MCKSLAEHNATTERQKARAVVGAHLLVHTALTEKEARDTAEEAVFILEMNGYLNF